MSGEATSSICFSGYPSQYFARRTAAAVRSPYTPSMGPGSNVPNELCSSTRCAWATSPPSIGGALRCSGTAVVVVAMSRRNTSPATGLSSVEPRILGHPGHEPVLAALALEHLAPQRVGVGAEHVTRQRGLDEPGVLLELALQLPLAPAGVAGVHPHPRHLVGERVHVRLDTDRCDRPAHRALGRQAGVLGERDHRLRLHRP